MGLLGQVCQVAVCGGVFCGSCKAKGEEYGLTLPANGQQLEKLGIEWFQKALTKDGSLNGTVKSAAVKGLGANGLLSDIMVVTLKVKEGDVEERQMEFLVKLAPRSFKTRITTDVFKLSFCEYMFYQTLGTQLAEQGMRTPRLIMADFNQTSGLYYLGLEKLDAKFKDVRCETGPDAITLSDAEGIFSYMADWHAYFWGDIQRARDDLGFIMRGDGPMMAMAAKESKRHWSAFKRFVTERFPAGALTDDLVQLFNSGLQKDFVKYTGESMGWGWTALCHGDCRLDNFFFEHVEGSTDPKVGLLDFQLAVTSNVSMDIVNMFTTSIPDSMADEHGDRLISIYHDRLTKLLEASGIGHPPGGIDSLREQIALAVGLSYVKTVIGVGGTDPRASEVVSETNFMFVKRLLASLKRFDTCGVFTKYQEGSMLAQLAVKKGVVESQGLGPAASPTVVKQGNCEGRL